MNCKQTQNSLLFYIENAVSESISQNIKTHIDGCVSCRNLYQSFLSEVTEIQNYKSIEVKPFLFTRLEQRLEKTAQNPFYKLFGFELSFVYKPAIYTLILFAGLFIGISTGINISSDNSAMVDDERTENIQNIANEFNINEFKNESIENYLLNE